MIPDLEIRRMTAELREGDGARWLVLLLDDLDPGGLDAALATLPELPAVVQLALPLPELEQRIMCYHHLDAELVATWREP